MPSDDVLAGGASGPSLRTLVLYLVGVAGLAFSVTLLFIEMRAVLDVGGSCADGGPYVSAQPCPGGTWLMFVAIFGGFGWGALAMATGAGLGGRFAAVPYLWWPALFCSLGFNFLQYGIASPDGGGLEWGFLIPGVLFEVMGAVPLVLGLRFGGSADGSARQRLRQAQLAAGLRVEAGDADMAGAMGSAPTPGSMAAATTPGSVASATTPGSMASPTTPGSMASALEGGLAGALSLGSSGSLDLAGELERLADLHDRGALTDAEFAAAKAALLP